MTTALQMPGGTSSYADCLEAIHARLAAREAKLFGIAIIVVYVHQLERLFASVGQVNAARMLDELRNRLSQVSKPGDYFARIGDRKFVFVVSNLRNSGHALLAANKILRAGAEPVTSGGQHANLRLSIGIAMYPAHARTPEGLMQCAETALLEAWKTQAATVVYTDRKTEELVAGWDLETQLANALEHGDLVLNYQPKLSLPKLEVVGVEALMRWNRPDAGNVPPEIFIDVAEMTGQIDPLTRFAFDRALRQLREWPKGIGPIGVAVNVTPSIICNPELVDVIKGAAGPSSVSLARLTVEVTENALMVDRERSHGVLTELRELGARISIDDFGTGYSSPVLPEANAGRRAQDRQVLRDEHAQGRGRQAHRRADHRARACVRARGGRGGRRERRGCGETRHHRLRLRTGISLRKTVAGAGIPRLAAGLAQVPWRLTAPRALSCCRRG